MRYIISTILLVLAFIGCNQKPKQKQSVTQRVDSISISVAKSIEDTINFLFNPVDSPLTVCGITVGNDVDSEVVNKYGEGYYIQELGHGGGRMFVDKVKKLTLITTIGVDGIIEEVELYNDFKRPKDIMDTVLDKKAYAHVNIKDATINKFTLGVSSKVILRAFGKPLKTSLEKSILRYEYYYDFLNKKEPNNLPYFAEFMFKNDTLITVIAAWPE